jgi:ABC-2 type transport system ATP-binding protein
VLGYDVVTNSLEIRARTGYVSEVNSLYDYLTIPQLCNFCRDSNRHWNQAIVDQYIKLFGLPAQSKVAQLSKGMKSQLALSLALGSEPDLLILDEPTSGLDPIARRQFLGTLIREVAAEGKTIFFSSHILSEVEEVADHVGIINKGKLVVSDDLDNLKQTHKVVRLLYANSPAADDLAALRALPGVNRMEQEGRSIRIEASGDIDRLVQAIQARSPAPRDVDVTNLNLEDLFIEYMKEDGNDR